MLSFVVRPPEVNMRQTFWILASLLLAVGPPAPCQEKEPRKADGPAKVVKETVTSTNHSWVRLTGKVKVIDASTLRFEDGTQVDLHMAMDVPEPGQMGRIDGKLYPCGKEAAEFLAKPVAVYVDRRLDLTKIPSGKCYVGETHVHLEMVRNGWAVSTHSGMDPWEIIARENKRGMWRGEFVVPEEWRTGKRLPGEK
jgi:endonuclease YncB( thermonuclease family)